MRLLAAATTVLVLFVAGCGGDDEEAERADGTPTPTAESQPAPTETTDTEITETEGEDGGRAASPDEEAAIRETLVTWLLEGPCEVMSDKFLEEQAFTGDTREERCEAFRTAYTKPQYGEDDIVTKDYTVDGDRASAVVADHISNVETTFNLIREDGKWVIDGTDL